MKSIKEKIRGYKTDQPFSKSTMDFLGKELVNGNAIRTVLDKVVVDGKEGYKVIGYEVYDKSLLVYRHDGTHGILIVDGFNPPGETEATDKGLVWFIPKSQQEGWMLPKKIN